MFTLTSDVCFEHRHVDVSVEVDDIYEQGRHTSELTQVAHDRQRVERINERQRIAARKSW